MVSSRGQSKGCLATFVERKTRFYVAIKIDDWIKDSMFLAISSLYNTLTSKLLKTFTVDHGKEFACALIGIVAKEVGGRLCIHISKANYPK